MAILIAATVYQSFLCLVHTHLFRATTSMVGLAELSIYVVAAFLLFKRIELSLMALITVFGSYLLLLGLLRGTLDLKSFRDIYSLVIFFYLGRNYGDVPFADRVLKIIIYIVLAVGFFELLFVDIYSRLFNVYSYYVSQGSVLATTNWAEGSTLALNGIRPAGIGRTILPFLLGSHRVSSVFLEPVSLGNFAVIVAAWGLCKPRSEWRAMLFFCVASAVMITLADSRYGMVAVLLIALVRLTFAGFANRLFILLPFVCVLILILFGLFYSRAHYSDNIPGRLYSSGVTLVRFGVGELFGLANYGRNYGDMGYSIVLTRFGLIGCAALWIALWMVKMRDESGEKFRTYVVTYMCLILCISGTSLFALKSAGILWFLFGCVTMRAATTVPRPGAAVTSPFTGKVRYAD